MFQFPYRANALENTETIKKSQKSKKSLQKEEKKVRYYQKKFEIRALK